MSTLRRVRTIAICSCMVVALVAGTTVQAVAGPLTLSVREPVAATPQREDLESLDGNRVVWSELSGDYDLWTKDVTSSDTPVRLTDNATLDGDAKVSGTRVVWNGTDGDTEIYYRDLRTATTVNLSDNTVADQSPQIDGSSIAWQTETSGADWEISFIDPNLADNPSPLTSNTDEESAPRVSGRRVIWNAAGDVFLWDGATRQVTQLAANGWGESQPDVGSERAAWGATTPFGAELFTKPFGGALRIFTFGASYSTVSQVQADGTLVAFGTSLPGGPAYDLWVWDAATGKPPMKVAENLTQASPYSGFYLRDPYLVFSSSDATDHELRVWDKSSRQLSTLTANSTLDCLPQVSGTRVAWQAGFGATADVYTATLVKSTPTLALSSPTLVNYAASTKLAGSLKWGASPLAARKVALEYSYNGSSWKAWKTVTTSSTGAFAAWATPTRTTYYRARFAGDAAFGARTSASRRVLVRAYLTRPSGPKSIEHGDAFTSTGYLKPRHTAGTKPVRIQCYRKESGVYRLKKTYYAKVSNYSSYSKYRASVTLPSAGSWRVRAYYPTSATNYKKYSTYRYITAK